MHAIHKKLGIVRKICRIPPASEWCNNMKMCRHRHGAGIADSTGSTDLDGEP